MAQRILGCGLFASEDSLNMLYLSELYFLYSILREIVLTQGHSLPTSYIVQPLVLLRGMWLGASLPQLLDWLVLTLILMIECQGLRAISCKKHKRDSLWVFFKSLLILAHDAYPWNPQIPSHWKTIEPHYPKNLDAYQQTPSLFSLGNEVVHS